MNLKRGSKYDIMQVEIVYLPAGHTDSTNLFEKVTFDSDGYYTPHTCIDECFTNEDSKQTVLYPVMFWNVIGFAGVSNDTIICGTQDEYSMIGGMDLFDGFQEWMWEHFLPKFEQHPRLRKELWKGMLMKDSMGNPLRYSLDEYDQALVINAPLVWYYWSSCDDYTGEMDVEVTLQGELDMMELKIKE